MAAEPESRQNVSYTDSEELISGLLELPGNPRLGFFGPGSVSWRINRESAVFLGAGRAALLQIAHPWVAASLTHHSNLLNNPIGRFHSTFRVVYTMLFGARAQAVESARQLYRLHTTIRGELPHAIGAHRQGEHYQANEVAALRWVYATLVESAILAYEFVLPPLQPGEREDYYAESKRMAALCGIPAGSLPTDWAAFSRYTAEMLDSPLLGVGPEGQALGHSVLSGAGSRLHPPLWYRALTAYWMPPRLRSAFALSFDVREEAALRRCARWLPRLYRRLPETVRFVGPYHEAAARLRGRSPGPLIRRSNSFWMGQPRLLHSDLSQ